MKPSLDRRLMAGFVATALIWVALVLRWLGFWPFPEMLSQEAVACLALSFSALPAGLFQWFLCRRTKGLRFAPLLLLGTTVAYCLVEFALSRGWDSFGWLVVLTLCFAQRVGCALGFGAHALLERSLKK